MHLLDTSEALTARDGESATPSYAGIRNIVFPEAEQIRSRKIVTRSRARSTGKFPSWKMGRMLQWESTHELNAFRILDCDPRVTSFREQPCEVVYMQDGVAKSHFPDILVEVDGRKELWEVKPRSEASSAEFVERTAILMALTNWGYAYRVEIAEDLAVQPRLANAMRLLWFGGPHSVTVMERESIRLTLLGKRFLTWGDACKGLCGRRSREILCRLALEGILTLDIGAPWTEHTPFFARMEAL